MSDGSEDEDGVGKNFENVHIKTLSVDNIDIPGTDTNDVGTIKLADNLEIAGDGLILHDLEDYDFSTANIDLDNTDDNNDNIVTYSDNTTTTVTTDNSARIITVADSTKSSTSEQNISINGRPYTVIQSGTTITLVDTLKKIISLEAGNLVVATYQSDGTRIDKEIIMDTNNSISEIAGGEFDLKVKTLDVTNTTSINESAPSPDGSARIDNKLTVGGATTLNGAVTLGNTTSDDITITGRVASHIVPKTDVAFDLGTTDLGFNDLHLGSGGIINLYGGDITLTHSTGKLTLGGDGDVEFDFANHEMTNVDINSGVIDGVTIGTNSPCTSLVVTTADINGGAIDGTVIGATSAAAGTFTTLTVNDELVIAAGATITGDTEGQITLNVEGAPGQTQDIFTVRQNGAVVNKLEVDKDGVTTAASLVATTADINAGTIDNTTIGASTAVAGTFTNLTSNTSLISSKSFVITPSVITSASIDENNPTDLDESVSVFYFDLNNTSAMYGIFAAGTTGQMINIFYDNNEAAGSLKIDFGATKLRTGSGESRYLTFTITGQSASLMYISTVDKWCVTNTGAAVS